MALAQVNTAEAAVFATTELLEAILLLTDMKTVLLAQRVNRKFHDVITSSTRLQKKLFMLPATFEEAVELCATSAGWLATGDGSSPTLFRRCTNYGTEPQSLPEMYVPNLMLFGRPRYDLYQATKVKLPYKGTYKGGPRKLKEGSWTNMYLVHPCPLRVYGKISMTDFRTFILDGYSNDDCQCRLAEVDRTIGSWMDGMEKHAIRMHGHSVVWDSSKILAYALCESAQV